MEAGDRFKIKGYDVVAMVTVAEGGGDPEQQEVLVLNNNSSHYLVAWHEPENLDAILIEFFGYAQHDQDVVRAYKAALYLAIDVALTN